MVIAFQDTKTQRGMIAAVIKTSGKADPVETQAVVNGRGRDPGDMFGELHLTGLWIKEPPEREGDEQISQSRGQRNPSSGRFRYEIHRDGSRKGKHEEE